MTFSKFPKIFSRGEQSCAKVLKPVLFLFFLENNHFNHYWQIDPDKPLDHVEGSSLDEVRYKFLVMELCSHNLKQHLTSLAGNSQNLVTSLEYLLWVVTVAEGIANACIFMHGQGEIIIN